MFLFILVLFGLFVLRVVDISFIIIEFEWEFLVFNGGGEIIGYFVDK